MNFNRGKSDDPLRTTTRKRKVMDYVVMERETNEQSLSINQLQPHLSNTVVIGLVINKQSVQSFPDKRNPGSTRYKMTFSIRDTPTEYINVTCWGSKAYISGISQMFKMYDVVKIYNCQVSSKPGGELDDKWSPWTPSPYQLSINETYSSVSIYNGENLSQLLQLAHVPLRPYNDYYTLNDIHVNGQSLDCCHVNILAIVGHVGIPKEMTSKSGRYLKKCDVILFDQGCNNFEFTIWDSEMIDLAQTWIPKENIIFVVDVKATFNSYKNSMTGVHTNKTIITTNPDCPQAHQLYQYAQTTDIDFSSYSNNISQSVDLKSIKDVVTISQLANFKMADNADNTDMPNMCISYAYLTSLDIDGDTGYVTTYQCSGCKLKLPNGYMSCSNQSCSTGNSAVELVFDIYISLADHTGSADNLKLNGQVANDFFHITPTELLGMSCQERVELKASLILERVKVFFKCSTFGDQHKASVRILHIEHADPNEVAIHLQ